MACPEALPTYYKSCMNFTPEAGGEDNTFGITVEEEWPLFVDLQWGSPGTGSTTDLDAFLVREGGKKSSKPPSTTPNTEPGRQEPYEFIPWEAHAKKAPEEEVEVVIARCDTACGEERAEEEIEGEAARQGRRAATTGRRG